jgi:trk system potassium uptake protein TrkA
MALARELALRGVQVLAIDRSMQLVNEAKDHVDLAVRLDSTDRDALLAQEVDKVDIAVVSIGENFEASLLTTALLQKMEVPRVICRAQTQTHAEIFRQIGAHEVIQPESSAGQQMALRLANPRLSDVIDLAPGFALVEITAPESWWNVLLKELDLRRKFQVNLVAIKRGLPESGEDSGDCEIVSVPRPDDPILENDHLILVGDHEAIQSLPKA